MENATNKANHGKSISYEMIQGYEELPENITKLLKLLKRLQELQRTKAGITQINDVVTGLDRQTQQNAQIASQTKRNRIRNRCYCKRDSY